MSAQPEDPARVAWSVQVALAGVLGGISGGFVSTAVVEPATGAALVAGDVDYLEVTLLDAERAGLDAGIAARLRVGLARLDAGDSAAAAAVFLDVDERLAAISGGALPPRLPPA